MALTLADVDHVATLARLGSLRLPSANACAINFLRFLEHIGELSHARHRFDLANGIRYAND